MSMITLADVKRISAEALSGMILGDHPSLAIIDVRDGDHIGGHIKNSHHFPSGSLDATMPALIRKAADKQAVVFHCALSQQRGPSAALQYLREKERLDIQKTTAKDSETKEESLNSISNENQVVYILDRGFVGWQEKYGEDERLTSGYRKEIWKDGYWM